MGPGQPLGLSRAIATRATRLPSLLVTSSRTIASTTSERTDAGAGAKTCLLVMNDYRAHRTATRGISRIGRCHPKEVLQVRLIVHKRRSVSDECGTGASRATIELEVEGLSDADARWAVPPSKLATAADEVKHTPSTRPPAKPAIWTWSGSCWTAPSGPGPLVP